MLPTGRQVLREQNGRTYTDHVTDTIYRVHENIEVRIGDVSKVGAVIDSAMGRNITDISEVRFNARDVRDVQEEALREATVRVRQQPETIASASNLRLGNVIELNTEGWPTFSRGSVMSVTSADLDTGSTVVVTPSIQVSVTVYGRWLLVPPN